MDFSQLSDVQLDHLLGQVGADPFSEDYRETQALRAEKERRLRARSARPQPVAPKPPENVDANLEAAATPIAVESTAGEQPASWRSMSDEDIAAPLELEAGGGQGVTRADLAKYGERYRQAIRNNYERAVAGRKAELDAGYQDPDQAAYNAATGLPDYPTTEIGDGPIATGGPTHGGRWVRSGMNPERLYGGDVPAWAQGAFGSGTDNVDGVDVATFDLGDGKRRYRLGDVRRAQEAAADARWLAGHRALVDSENARYGHYSIRDGADELTPEQQEARYRRKRAEGRQAAQREASRQYQIANKDRELTPYEQQQKDRRAAVAARAQLAGGSQNLNSGNSATINALLALDPEDRQDALRQMLPINPMRAQVEAAHNAQLTQLGLRVAQGQGFQTDPLAAAQGAAAQQQVEAGKPLVQRAQEAGAAGRFNDPDIFAHADEMVHNHYSSRPGVLGVSTHFTDNEVAIGAQRLADELDIPFEEAEKVMRRIQQDRNRNRPASTVASWMYDQ